MNGSVKISLESRVCLCSGGDDGDDEVQVWWIGNDVQVGTKESAGKLSEEDGG